MTGLTVVQTTCSLHYMSSAWDSTPPASWPALDDIMAMTWGPTEDWDAIPVPLISLGEPHGEPLGTLHLDLAQGGRPGRGDLISLAGLTAAHSTLPGSNVRVAAAWDDYDAPVLVTCHRLPARDRLSDYPADYRAYQASGGTLLPCCEPDGDDRQQLCGNVPEPGSRHCAAHQDQDDARRRLTAWRDAGYRQPSEREALIRDSLAAGITKHAIHQLSGIARTTVDDVLAGQS